MSLTKATYSMITGAPVNVLDFGADPTGATDSTSAIQAALGGAGTTPDNTYVYFPNGTYKISSPIKVYRSGQTLSNVSIVGESAGGVLFTGYGSYVGKGIVVGEPAVGDNLWGSNSNTASAATYTVNVEVRNISHEFNDIGLWFVYCKNVIVDNIQGYNLVCAVAGNDAWDNCYNVRMTNVTRMNDGLNLSPDSWYSIALYQTSGFVIDKFYSNYLSAASGTGGCHISINSSNFGSVTNCVINQTTASGQGILLSSSKNVVVANNSLWILDQGIVTYGTTSTNNLIANNVLNTCIYGICPFAPNNTYSNNTVVNSTTADFYSNNTDGITNTYVGNNATTFVFPSSVQQYQYFVSNPNIKQQIFIPASDFVQYYPSGTTTYDPTSLNLTNSGGSIRAFARLDTGGRSGLISNVTFVFNRLVGSTAVNCYVATYAATNSTSNVGQVIDTTSTTGVVNAVNTFYSGSTYQLSGSNVLLAIYIPTAASISSLVGVVFDFQENGLNLAITN